MDLKQKIDEAETWLFESRMGMTGVMKWIHRVARIIYAVVRDLLNGNLTLHAMGLVYTSLLSVVPLLALSFSVLKSMGVHNRLTPFLYNFFEPMGPQGVEIADNVLGFVDNIKVGVLGSVGLALLIYTVISLVQKIERAFNYIWAVPQLRSISDRFSNYLSVIMVGPLLVASAIGTTAAVMESSVIQGAMMIEPLGVVVSNVTRLMPFLFIIAAFTFIYMFMPNTPVRFRSALLGGAVSGSIWQMTGVLFASFVVGSVKYEAIYSGFAVGILLLIWIYTCWIILLLGSSIAYYDQNFSQITREYKVKDSAEISEKLALEIMVEVADRYDRGEPAIEQLQLEAKLKVPATLTRDVTDKLLRQSLLGIAGKKGGALVPARSIDRISVYDVYKAVRIDEDDLSQRFVLDEKMTTIYESIDKALESELKGISLQTVVRRA